MKTGDYAVMLAALIALGLSVYLWFSGQREEGVFVGLWVPSVLVFATFLKLSAWRR